MSAFLGPIHYWLFNKINLQENLVKKILDAAAKNNWNPNLEQEADETYGKPDNRPLEDIIDGNNIHGWLQERIAKTEARLAFVVTSIIKNNPDYLLELKKIAYSFGELNLASENIDAEGCYKLLNDSLIDGMPCDRVNEVIELDKDKIVWVQNTCVHADYWVNVNGDINVYYAIRHEIIKGMLSRCDFEYVVNEDGLNIIKRK